MRHRPPLVLVALVMALAVAPPAAREAAGQAGSAITGYVRDVTSQSIPGASIEILDDGGRPVRTAVSDATGLFRIVEMPPRAYVLRVSAAGFAPARRHVALEVDSTLQIDVVLSIAGIAQAVDVVADAPAALASSSPIGLVVERERVAALPLNRRDFLQLALLAAGVAPPVEDSELSARGAFAMHVNGGREEANDFLLDGVDNNDAYVNRYVVQPPVDAIQEFKVVTNGYSAEYGRNAAGQVNVVTRAGSSRLRAFGYEYFRDGALDARNYFEAPPAPAYRRDQLGAGAGGPIAPRRAYFFATADWLRERRAVSRLAVVPTAAERAGDLSALGLAVRDPFTGRPFGDGVIPADRISPVALRVLQSFPLPNRDGATNYLGQSTAREDQVQGYVRVDFAPSARDQVMARYSHGDVKVVEPYVEEGAGVPGFGDQVKDRLLNATAQYQRTLGARAVSSLRLGVNRLARDLLAEQTGEDVGDRWSVGWLDVVPRAMGYPSITVAGYSKLGDGVNLPILRASETWHAAETLTFDRGAHLVRAGGEVRHARLSSTIDLMARGSLSFSGAITGAGIGDLLLGLPSFALRAVADNPMHLRSTLVAAFVQDEWRMGPAVTVNAGLRYEVVTQAADPTGRLDGVSAGAAAIAAVAAGSGTRTTPRTDRNNLAPRFGIALHLPHCATLRAGYGVFYDAGMFVVASAQYFNPPFFTLRMYFPSAMRLLTLSDPFPGAGGLAPPPSLNLLSPDLRSASMHHWHAAVEREFGWLGTARVGYAGSRGVHLVAARDLNQPPPGEGAVQPRRPHPAYGSIFFVESRGASSYHALQATLDRPLRGGISWMAAYTLGRSMDTNSAFLETGPDRNIPQNSRDVSAEYGPSSFDVRHRLSLAAAVELPRRHWLTRDTWVRAVAMAQSGAPFTPVLRFDNSNTGNSGGTTGSDRPDRVGTPAVPHPTADRWFDTAAFVMPARFTFGTSGRNGVRGPGYASLDLSMSRRVPLRGGAFLTVELQAFNALNRANFDLPQMYVDEPATFGRVLSAKPPRQVQLAARVEF